MEVADWSELDFRIQAGCGVVSDGGESGKGGRRKYGVSGTGRAAIQRNALLRECWLLLRRDH